MANNNMNEKNPNAPKKLIKIAFALGGLGGNNAHGAGSNRLEAGSTANSLKINRRFSESL